MAKIGRDEPCPCGSGRKAKRCCGVGDGGPSEESRARAFLAAVARNSAPGVGHLSDEAFLALYEEACALPATDLSLQVNLPKLASPELGRLYEAVADNDPDPDLLVEVTKQIDTPIERARLARAVIAKAEAGAIEERVAAAALLDLGSPQAGFLRASLLQAASVQTGAARTPAGMLLAA
jgi:SEC-C motif